MSRPDGPAVRAWLLAAVAVVLAVVAAAALASAWFGGYTLAIWRYAI